MPTDNFQFKLSILVMKLNERKKRLPSVPLSQQDSEMRNLKQARVDRFIPQKVSCNHFQLFEKPYTVPEPLGDNHKSSESRTKDQAYNNILLETLLSSSNEPRVKSRETSRKRRNYSVLSFKKDKNDKENGDVNVPEEISTYKPRVQNYLFNKKEIKILEAPSLADSFYFNILDFSPDDTLAVSLANHIYSFDYKLNTTNEIISLEPGNIVSSLSFNKENAGVLACGTVNGGLQLIDVDRKALLRQYRDPSDERIGAMDWKETLLCHGAKSGRLYLKDTRAKDSQVAKFFSHTQEICNAKFNPFNNFYLISGGNDDKVVLYDLRTMKEMAKFDNHRAAVKGLAWSNSRPSTFVSGGGSGDRQICLWDVNRLGMVQKTTRGSQVCNLGFTCDGLILSTQGYPFNSIELLDSNTLECVATFSGHTQRVLFLALNRAQNVAVTGSPDETLRFWNVKNLMDSGRQGDRMGGISNGFALSLR